MSSFIKASKSVPPASTKAPPEAAPSRLKACFVLVGLAYSKALITHLLSGRVRRVRGLGLAVGRRRVRRWRWRLYSKLAPREKSLEVRRDRLAGARGSLCSSVCAAVIWDGGFIRRGWRGRF